MAKKPSVFVNKEVSELYGRLAKIAASNALASARDTQYRDADTSAKKAREWAEIAGGAVMRGVVLA